MLRHRRTFVKRNCSNSKSGGSPRTALWIPGVRCPQPIVRSWTKSTSRDGSNSRLERTWPFPSCGNGNVRGESGSECYFTIPLARKVCGRPRWMGSCPERRKSTLIPISPTKSLWLGTPAQKRVAFVHRVTPQLPLLQSQKCRKYVSNRDQANSY